MSHQRGTPQEHPADDTIHRQGNRDRAIGDGFCEQDRRGFNLFAARCGLRPGEINYLDPARAVGQIDRLLRLESAEEKRRLEAVIERAQRRGDRAA